MSGRVQGRGAVAVAACISVAFLTGCSGDTARSLGSFDLSKSADIFKLTTADSTVIATEDTSLGRAGPVAPEELVGPGGQCAPVAVPVAAAAPQPPGAPVAPGAPAAPAVPAAPAIQGTPDAPANNEPAPVDPSSSLLLGGIALGMSECDVVRRAGHPGNVVISADERGDRMVELTYLTGSWPGIYKFSSGRLKVLERGPEPPEQPKPAARKKSKPKPKAKKPAPQASAQ